MRRFTLFVVLNAWLLLATRVLAQGQDTGTIIGRIYNPNTGEYVRNAEVRVQESGVSTTSENGGEYRLGPVAAGKVTLVVSYTGSRSMTAMVDVAAGATVTKDFELVSSLQTAAEAAAPVTLSKFVVSTEREGNAKAIMEQRNSMNITNTVASDSFGDNAEGNIGEFLKHMPGVELDIAFGEVRNIRLRGLGSEYTAVTLDGVSLASADANNGSAANARAFSFEQVSLASMESIEVSKTISADVDANAPAGTINLKSKRAFDRAGRRISWQTNVAVHSEEFNLKREMGPDERSRLKVKPGGIFDYSDVFLDKRLGIVFSLIESNHYQEAMRTTLTFNRVTTATDTRPEIITEINHNHAPRFNKRFSTTLTGDFKATPNLVLSLAAIYNYADLWNPQRTARFLTGGRTTVVGTDPLVSFTTTSAGSVISNPANVAKMGTTLTLLPKFELKLGALTIDGNFAYSNSSSWYNPLARRGSIRDTNGQTVSAVVYHAERSGPEAVDWKITQLGGRDIADGASYTSPAVTIDDGRFSRTELHSGQVTGTLRTNFLLPTVWKTGLKHKLELRKWEDDTELKRSNYVGGGATGTGAWANYASPYPFDVGQFGAATYSLSGRNIFMPHLLKIAELYGAEPQNFRPSISTANYYNANVANRRKYEETIDAAYLMGTTRVREATVRVGVRWERTETDALDYDVIPAAEVRRAGFTTDDGRALTIPGIDYQYLSKPRIHRLKSYDNLFPSASFKYRLLRNLDLHVGYSSTIRRPTFIDVLGVWAVNDENQRITAPNTGLKPETSDNFSVRLANYFEPVGTLAVNFFQNNIQDLHLADELTAEEFGYTGDVDYSAYTFVSKTNSATETTVRGMELEYSQSLSFLKNPILRGFGVRASYTRTYANVTMANLSPHSVSAGLNYYFRRFSANANYVWNDDQPRNVAHTSYRRQRSTVDVGAGFKISATTRFFVNARNVTNSPFIIMTRVPPHRSTMAQYELFGINWTFGVSGQF